MPLIISWWHPTCSVGILQAPWPSGQQSAHLATDHLLRTSLMQCRHPKGQVDNIFPPHNWSSPKDTPHNVGILNAPWPSGQQQPSTRPPHHRMRLICTQTLEVHSQQTLKKKQQQTSYYFQLKPQVQHSLTRGTLKYTGQSHPIIVNRDCNPDYLDFKSLDFYSEIRFETNQDF